MKSRKPVIRLALVFTFVMLFSILGNITQADAYKGLILPSGEKMAPMELLTLTPGADPTLNQEAVFIAEWWKKIGIPVEAKPMEKGALVKKIFWGRDFDATIWYIGGERFPSYIQYYYSAAEIYEYGWNFMQYKNPKYDQLSSDWLTMLDRVKAQKSAFKLQKIIADENPQIPLISDTQLTAYNNKRWKNWTNQYGGIHTFDSICSIDPVDGDTAKDILKIGILKEPDILNPLGTGFSDTWTIIYNIYCGGMWTQQTALYRIDPGSGKIIPFLADGDLKYDDAANTAIVKLKKGIKWHDGTKLTAADIKFTVDLIKEFKVPNYKDCVDLIDKVEALDEYTLKYYLTKKNVNFYNKTMMMIILQKQKWSTIAQEAKKQKDPTKHLTQYQIKNPMGAGPFKFADWKKGSYILLDKNPDWFFKDYTMPMGTGTLKFDLKVDKILFKFYASKELRTLALKNGDIDLCTIEIASKDDFKADKKMTIVEWGNDWTDFIGFNCTKAPFNDPAFRKALHYLIDKKFFVKKLQQGYAVPQYTVVPAVNQFWSDPKCPTYGAGWSMKKRIKKAVKILKKAGYTWESKN